MKTFTVRDLDRKPGAVLDVCDKEGAVRIQRRDRRQYTVRPENRPGQKVPWVKLFAEHRARMKPFFAKPVSRAEADELDKLMAGE